MPRLKLTLQYDGTRYAGWQVQANGPSIQAAVQDAFQTLQFGRAPVTGASRTDAGVHATGQVCHVDLAEDPGDGRRLAHSLNGVLPRDIRVVHLDTAADDFHARYQATAKAYRYLIATQPAPPLLRHCVWEHGAPLDRDAMREAAQCLIGTHDFGAFQAAGATTRDTRRTVFDAQLCTVEFPGLTPVDAPLLAFDICGNGFLYKMVRRLVGTLVEIGTGRLGPDALAARLGGSADGQRRLTAPAKGLCLRWISYVTPPPTLRG